MNSRPNHRNKAPFSTFSGIVWTGPFDVLETDNQLVFVNPLSCFVREFHFMDGYHEASRNEMKLKKN